MLILPKLFLSYQFHWTYLKVSLHSLFLFYHCHLLIHLYFSLLTYSSLALLLTLLQAAKSMIDIFLNPCLMYFLCFFHYPMFVLNYLILPITLEFYHLSPHSFHTVRYYHILSHHFLSNCSLLNTQVAWLDQSEQDLAF